MILGCMDTLFDSSMLRICPAHVSHRLPSVVSEEGMFSENIVFIVGQESEDPRKVN